MDIIGLGGGCCSTRCCEPESNEMSNKYHSSSKELGKCNPNFLICTCILTNLGAKGAPVEMAIPLSKTVPIGKLRGTIFLAAEHALPVGTSMIQIGPIIYDGVELSETDTLTSAGVPQGAALKVKVRSPEKVEAKDDLSSPISPSEGKSAKVEALRAEEVKAQEALAEAKDLRESLELLHQKLL